MSPDLAAFTRCMDGEWVVERYELDPNEKLRVYYRSKVNPEMVWSHNPHDFDRTPPVGTVGRIGFFWHKE